MKIGIGNDHVAVEYKKDTISPMIFKEMKNPVISLNISRMNKNKNIKYSQ